MIKKITGYVLAVIGLIGLGFFENYDGSLIPYPIIWIIASIVIGAAGAYLIAVTKVHKISRQQKANEIRLRDLQQHAERILLTPDNYEIRENNYYQKGNDNEPDDNYKQRYIEQSAIVYYYNHDGKTIRMTSQTFSANAKMLKGIIEDGKLILYVNRFDKNDYAFDFAD